MSGRARGPAPCAGAGPRACSSDRRARGTELSWRHSDGADVRGLRALLALLDVELHALVLLERAIARRLDGGEVDEDVGRAAVGRDEPVALLAVEPLYGALCHWCFSFGGSGIGDRPCVGHRAAAVFDVPPRSGTWVGTGEGL